MNKKNILIGIIGAIVGLIIVVSVVVMSPQQEPTELEEELYFWAQVEESRLIVFITNEGDELVVLKRIVLPDYGVTTPLMELARIQPDTTLPYLLIQNDPILCDEIASANYLTIRIVTEKGIYENWNNLPPSFFFHACMTLDIAGDYGTGRLEGMAWLTLWDLDLSNTPPYNEWYTMSLHGKGDLKGLNVFVEAYSTMIPVEPYALGWWNTTIIID